MSGVRGIEAREGGSGVLRHVRARDSQIDRVGLLIGDKQSGSVSTNFLPVDSALWRQMALLRVLAQAVHLRP